MIPKIIHYCWFGYNKKPGLIKKCIASWRKYMPDWEIREWNESNYDVTKNQEFKINELNRTKTFENSVAKTEEKYNNIREGTKNAKNRYRYSNKCNIK